VIMEKNDFEIGHRIKIMSMHVDYIILILYFEFYVLLTVHPATTLGKWPVWCTITLRAHRTVTYRECYTRCCINTILPPDDEHRVARNM